jgi:hypothetical protein
MFTMPLTDAGNPLGHILYAGGPTSGDCVVRSLTMLPKATDLPEAKHLCSLQQLGELAWSREREKLTLRSSQGAQVAAIADGWMVSESYRIRADHQEA